MGLIMTEETKTEEVQPVDHKEIERQMLEAAKNRADDPAETAAMIYTMYKPEFLKRLKGLSSRAKSRVLQLLVEHPLNDKALASTSQLEREVVYLGTSMLEAKFVMVMNVYKEGAEQLVQAQDEFLFKETEEKQGENNG